MCERFRLSGRPRYDPERGWAKCLRLPETKSKGIEAAGLPLLWGNGRGMYGPDQHHAPYRCGVQQVQGDYQTPSSRHRRNGADGRCSPLDAQTVNNISGAGQAICPAPDAKQSLYRQKGTL